MTPRKSSVVCPLDLQHTKRWVIEPAVPTDPGSQGSSHPREYLNTDDDVVGSMDSQIAERLDRHPHRSDHEQNQDNVNPT